MRSKKTSSSAWNKKKLPTMWRQSLMKSNLPVRGYSINGRRSAMCSRKVVLRRADIPDSELERGVRPVLNADGDFAHGQFPEQPELLSQWNPNWQDGGPAYTHWSVSQSLLGLAVFFSVVFTLKYITEISVDPYPQVVDREFTSVNLELGGKPTQQEE